MFKQNSKYRLQFLIFFVVLLVIFTVMNFIDYVEKKDGMKLTGGIVFGVLALVYTHDLYEFLKNKKRINS